MTLQTPMVFVPATGLRDVSAYPTIPGSEAALRDGVQKGMDQLRDFINQYVAGIAPTLATWTAPTLLNSWVNRTSGGEATTGYYKDDFNIVRVRGAVQLGVVTNGTIIFTFPVGYRPSGTEKFSCISYNGTSFVITSIYVTATGNVVIETGANIVLSLDPIQFRAEQ